MDDLQEVRKKQLQERKKQRKERLEEDNVLKMNREQMIANVASIVYSHIEAAERFIEEPT